MNYSFCPVCGSALEYKQQGHETVPMCTNKSCGFIFWQNSKPCVTAIISNEKNQILMTVRAREPEKGKLDLPGGFLELGEHPHDGVKREIQEEVGVKIEIIGHLGYAIDRYGKDGEYTLNIALIGKIINGEPKAGDDAAALEWIDPFTVTPGRLGFTNNAKFIELWIAHCEQEKNCR